MAGSCSGRFFALSCEGLKRALLGSLLISGLATAQTPQTPAPEKVGAKRANELTLAGLRPGRDGATKATSLYHKWSTWPATKDEQLAWWDNCRGQIFAIGLDGGQRIQVLRVTRGPQVGDCVIKKPTLWKTGLGLRVGDPASRVVQLYGEPDSRSPSTKDGQPLELWYYAFDWAGPDVPQVMEVLCTREKDGQPGYVVEITLAAPSL
ncbi:MAG TPA: hypothetical protein VN830_11000 [Verrucomicrobiae bacterium]|nr:hypothetical protein [Verrucomicrobiae bacterium]